MSNDNEEVKKDCTNCKYSCLSFNNFYCNHKDKYVKICYDFKCGSWTLKIEDENIDSFYDNCGG